LNEKKVERYHHPQPFFMKIYNIAILLTVAAGLVVSAFYGMLAGVVVNLALFLIVEKFLPEE
jgi:hypothetical protein